MMSLSCHIETSFHAYVVSVSAFNNLVERALAKVAEYWVKNFLPRHFTAEAMALYNLQPRAEFWGKPHRDGSRLPGTNEWKRRGQIPPDGFFNRIMRKRGVLQRGEGPLYTTVTPHPAGAERPLDWRGDLKRHVEGNSQSMIDNANKLAGGSPGGNVSVEIKIVFPHPVHPKFCKDIVKLNWQERHVLQSRFKIELREAIKNDKLVARSGVTFSKGNYPILPSIGTAA